MRIEQPAYQLEHFASRAANGSNPGSISASRTRLSNGILILQEDYRPSLVRGAILLVIAPHFHHLEWPCGPMRLSRENRILLSARRRRAKRRCQNSQLASVPLGSWFLHFAEPDIHLLSRARRPSQKIEFVFAASLETIRRSLGRLLSFARSAIRKTWQPARCVYPPSPLPIKLPESGGNDG